MDWSYPTDEMLAQDPAGIGVVVSRLGSRTGPPRLTGTRFLSSPAEMMLTTRMIEQAMGPGDHLAVGFQTFDRFLPERQTYQNLVDRGVDVTAYAHVETDADDPAVEPRDVEGLRWVQLAPHRRAVENQWFLVSEGSEPITFVGYDISAPEHIASGGVGNEARRFSGFVTDDRRVAALLLEHLARVARSSQGVGSVALSSARARAIDLILCATDEATAAYQRAREAATELARALGASLMLYDRSAESNLSDPYPYPEVIGPERPLSRLDAFKLGRSYLADQIDECTAAGVTASAWLPPTPGPKGLAEGVARFHPHLIVMPASLSRPRLIDRIRGNTLSRFRSVTSVSIWTVEDDGSITVPMEDRVSA